MTIDEYLSTCTNVPALPSGWHWHISVDNYDRESTVTGKSRNWTRVLIEISDREDRVQGMYIKDLMTSHLVSYPTLIDKELAEALRSAYNNLYEQEKLKYYKVLGIDPATL
jgi:hypothetical protein